MGQATYLKKNLTKYLERSVLSNRQEFSESRDPSQAPKMKGFFVQAVILLNFLSFVTAAPFFTRINSKTWVFGNELWNVTQKGNNAKPLYYKNKELVGKAVGHYYSSSTSLHFKLYLSTSLLELRCYHSGTCITNIVRFDR